MKPILILLTALLLAPFGISHASEQTINVRVDCSRPIEKPLTLTGCFNVSRRVIPPLDLPNRVEQEYGRPKIMRVWLMLDEMWDYRTDEYRFDYLINKDYYVGDTVKARYSVAGVPNGTTYCQYLDSAGRHSDALLLTIRGYEQDVLKGLIPVEKWRQVFKAALLHYKKRCPNLRYIEVLNEPTARNQSYIGSMDNYYKFYKPAYQAVNEVNAELRSESPLLVGGPTGFYQQKHVNVLIRDFARDEDPAKRLDFLSFHWYENNSDSCAGMEDEVVGELKKRSLPSDLPIFVTEFGYHHKITGENHQDGKSRPTSATSPVRLTGNQRHAAFVTECLYQTRHARQLRLFPWVTYHSDAQIHFAQFDTRMRMTPFGAAMKMLTLHKPREVFAESTSLNTGENKLGVLATKDDRGLAIQLWNLQLKEPRQATAEVVVANLPEPLRSSKLRVRRYQIDSKHSNCFAAPDAPGGLEVVEDTRQEGGTELRFSTRLEPMAFCLWVIEKSAD